MKNVYVTTYCTASSYGSILQSLGLKNALRSLGIESCIIKGEAPPSKRYPLRTPRRLSPGAVAVYLLELLHYKAKNTKHRNSNAFIDKHIDIAYYHDLAGLKNAFSEGGTFVAGSDQIWHPSLMSAEFFLDFLGDNAKKISYAASMGVTDIPKEREELLTRYLSTFDAVSVRENDCAKALSPFTDKPIDVHIDPTFLCDPSFWRSLQSPYKLKKPYILVYPIYWDPSYNDALRRLSKETGKEIVLLTNSPKRIPADRVIYDADPAQFLWLIDHADAVITSSFHGLSLSLIFNKAVVPVVNPSAPSRIGHLLSALGTAGLTIEDLICETPMNYDVVNDAIARERKRGLHYLKEALA